MKVLLLNGSSHPNGTTMAAIKEMEKSISRRRRRNRSDPGGWKADRGLSAV